MSDATARLDGSVPGSLYLGLEIADRTWKVASTVGLGQAPRVRDVPAGDLAEVLAEIERAKRRFDLPADTVVYSCYEAGRAGFFPHRMLTHAGIRNLVVDSSSIEVNRRKRRAKSDRLDGGKLTIMLVRYHQGDPRTWSVVRPPSPEEEDARHLHRSLVAAKRDRTRATNCIRGLLANQGIHPKSLRVAIQSLDELTSPTGEKLLPGLKQRIRFQWEKSELLTKQISRMKRTRTEMMSSCPPEITEPVRKLMQLKGIGLETAWLLTLEFFAWREFQNVKQVSALAGLAPTPHQSGDTRKELGITKSGNRLVRWILIEGAWRWLRYQPNSELTLWYERRFASGSSRQRKVGIVAVARKLLCQLWKYVWSCPRSVDG